MGMVALRDLYTFVTHEVVYNPWLPLEVVKPENEATRRRLSCKCKMNRATLWGHQLSQDVAHPSCESLNTQWRFALGD